MSDNQGTVESSTPSPKRDRHGTRRTARLSQAQTLEIIQASLNAHQQAGGKYSVQAIEVEGHHVVVVVLIDAAIVDDSLVPVLAQTTGTKESP